MEFSLSNYGHLDRFRPGATTERVAHVTLAVAPATFARLRPAFRDLDAILDVNGIVDVRCDPAIREACEVELHALGQGRYETQFDAEPLRLVKRRPRAKSGDGNRRWTIAVISGGGNEARLTRILTSVAAQGIDDVEVLIVGPAPKITLPEWARHVPFEENSRDPRFPITRKKNLVAAVARHENLLLLHDRFRLAGDWFKRVCAWRDDWDVLVMRMTFEGAPDSRLADWSAALGLSTATLTGERVAAYHASFPWNFRALRMAELPYAEYSPFVVVNGGAFAVKRSVLREVPLNPDLHWAEMEDNDWSRRLLWRGKVVSLAPDCVLESISDGRHSSARGSLVGRLAASRRLGPAFHGMRTALFRGAQALIDRLNRSGDFFTARGMFARRTRLIATDHVATLASLHWDEIDTVYLRGPFELTPDLRSLWREIKAAVPGGREIVLELATTGFGYFRRTGHRRTAESLCHEVSTALRSHFECRFLIATRQHNVIACYRRIDEPAAFPLGSLALCGAPPPPDFLARLGVSVVAADAADAILYVDDPATLQNAEAWKTAYARYGAACAPTRGARVLDGAVLLNRAAFESVLGTGTVAFHRAFRQAFETGLILEGVHPIEVA